MPTRFTRHGKSAAGPLAQPDHAAATDSQPVWKLLVRRGVVVAVAGLVMYLLQPKLTRVLASWPRLAGLAPAWMALAVAAEVASFVCYFGLQRLALRTSAWFAVATAGLTGNAISGILPAGPRRRGGHPVRDAVRRRAKTPTDCQRPGRPSR